MKATAAIAAIRAAKANGDAGAWTVRGERVKGWRDEGNGFVRGKPDTGRFPTVIEGFAENGKLRLVVHDVFSNRVVLDKYL